MTVTKGPDARLTTRVDRPSFVIGTGPGADLRLSDQSVSREHLRILLEPAGLRLRDYNEKTRPVLEMFGRKEYVHDIDARPPADDVQAKIREVLGLPA